MLKKLLKYEIASSARAFLPLYGTLLILALVHAITNTVFSKAILNFENEDIIYGLVFFAFSAIIFTLGAVTFMIIVNRFKKNLLGREGYLMFTLPVPVSLHIVSKFLSALIWQIFSSIVVILSSALIMLNEPTFRDVIEEIVELFSVAIVRLLENGSIMPSTAITLSVFSVLTTACASILLIYLAIAVGHLAKKHKNLLGITVFLIISSIVNYPSQILFSTFDINANTIVPYILLTSCINIVLTIIYFLITRYVLKHKLNLE